MGAENLLEIQELTHTFPLRRGLGIRAVDRLTLQLRRGEILGLVGEIGRASCRERV